VRTPGGEIVEGTLRSGEGWTYPIIHGIPDFSRGYRSEDEQHTVEAFGDEWARYDDFAGFMGSAELFTEFIGLTAADVRGRTVLEVGCGGGRWLRVLAGLGAAEVVGLDFSSAVAQAQRRCADLENVHVVRGSALEMPFRPVFDLVVSIGVIHHLDDPVLGLRGIAQVLRPDHVVAIWVYALEGNELYLKLARPLRWIGPRLPRGVLSAGSRVLALGLFSYIHSVNRLAGHLGVRLPLRRYLGMLYRLRLRDLTSVVHDQLTPSIARYTSRWELSDWITAAGGRITHLHHRTGNSWQCHLRFPR
jgi:SAM-dependent methyltransferase